MLHVIKDYNTHSNFGYNSDMVLQNFVAIFTAILSACAYVVTFNNAYCA